MSYTAGRRKGHSVTGDSILRVFLSYIDRNICCKSLRSNRITGPTIADCKRVWPTHSHCLLPSLCISQHIMFDIIVKYFNIAPRWQQEKGKWWKFQFGWFAWIVKRSRIEKTISLKLQKSVAGLNRRQMHTQLHSCHNLFVLEILFFKYISGFAK